MDVLTIVKFDSHSVNGSSQYDAGAISSLKVKIQDLILDLLEWVQYPDCAPAIGRCLAALLKSLDGSDLHYAPNVSSYQELPLWALPVRSFLDSHIDNLGTFSLHVLPDLLHTDQAGTVALINIMPFKDIQQGRIESQSIVDIQLCLLIARVIGAFPFNPVDEIFMPQELERMHIDGRHARVHVEDRISEIDVEELGINLLDHASPAVRISAFSLLISNDSALFVSSKMLQRLRMSLPYFHLEPYSKSRNEFIALMKKLLVKLLGKIKSELKTGPTAIDTRLNFDKVSQQVEVRPAKPEHQSVPSVVQATCEFLSWYLEFLIHDIRPNAPYQSHITALKVLQFMQHQLSAFSRLFIGYSQDLGILLGKINERLLLRPLLDILVDPFDDVRETATSILGLLLGSEKHSVGSLRSELLSDEQDRDDCYDEVFHTALDKAELQVSRTGRADHADGVGRLLRLLYTSCSLTIRAAHSGDPLIFLEKLMSTTEEEALIVADSLVAALHRATLHGHLIALR